MTVITKTSHDLFLAFARDAGNWSGSPLIGGNVGGSKEERGNLTQLKKAGLIETSNDGEGKDWLAFTDLGVDYAAEHGVEVDARQPSGKATGITVKDADAPKKKTKADLAAESPAETKVGPCKRVHQIADAMKGKTRKEVIDACDAEGINRGTARTQTGHWAKATGWTWPEAPASA